MECPREAGHRSAGGSFVACGVIAWLDGRSSEPSPSAWWCCSSCGCFSPFPPGKENVFLISADADLANVIDRFEASFNATVGAGARDRRHLALDARRAAAATAAAADARGRGHGADPRRADLLRRGDRRVHPLQPAGHRVLLVSVPLAFLFGMLHQQLARAGMADLVVALQRVPDSHRLGEALAKALGDPSLVLAYWLPRFDAYVDAEGGPVVLPREGSGRATTFVDNDGHHIAALVHDSALAASARPARGRVRGRERRARARAPAGGAERPGVRAAGLANESCRRVMPSADGLSATCTTRRAAAGRHRAADQSPEGAHPERSRGRRATGQDRGRRARALTGRAARARARHPPRRAGHRVAALEGHLRVSSPVGAGTVITAERPVRVASEPQASKAKTA